MHSWPGVSKPGLAFGGKLQECLDGKCAEILGVYRKRSAVIGKKVTVYADDRRSSSKIVTGLVSSIGENLELRLEGNGPPVWKGRLVLNNPDEGEEED